VALPTVIFVSKGAEEKNFTFGHMTTSNVTVSALLVNNERKVLLGLRASWKTAWPDHWDAIGGHVEAGETLEDALIREISEEVGVVATEFDLLASTEERKPELYGPCLHHIFRVRRWTGGEPYNACDEHSEIRWFDVEDLTALPNLVDCDYPRLARMTLGRHLRRPLMDDNGR
jgi:8-oxo-dGTP pyrophosphatase MutT (NUDIX family)